MTETVIFSIYELRIAKENEPDRVPAKLIDDLGVVYSDGIVYNPVGDRRFECRLSSDDSRLDMLITILANNGFEPGRVRKEGVFSLRIDREYTNADLESLHFMRPIPKREFCACRNRANNDYLTFSKISKRQAGLEIGFAGPASIVISSELREEFCKAGMVHLNFKRVELSGRAKMYENRFWEITSDNVLPSLAPNTEFTDNENLPFDGDLKKGCFLREGLYSTPEYHYSRNSIEMIENFDMALTKERFGNFKEIADRNLIASKRFYDLCQSLKLKMDWIPVRLDSD